ncbi:hypothetical protein [Glycomyces arizonensis]|uniref:hypothetical protein n=1 Tax=Glycomyces arizonensis TaxID=256035 RepID=UPI0012EB1A93|nr:hypothetical protein [Glycomyces arizonensis]
MVGVSLRQKPASATDQNAHISHRPVTRHAAARPVSGTPVWARNDHAPGAPRPASPWDTWTIPPKPAALNHTRKPSPHPAESAATSEPFRPWRIDFAHPDIVEYPPDLEPPEPPTVARRLLLLLGLAYLFLAALASGLAYTGYFTTTADPVTPPSPDDPEEPTEGTLPPSRPPRPPARHPDALGLHTVPTAPATSSCRCQRTSPTASAAVPPQSVPAGSPLPR